MGKLVYHSRGKEGQFALDVLLLDSVMGGEYISVQDTLSHDEGRERRDLRKVRIYLILDTSVHDRVPFVEAVYKDLSLVLLEVPEMAFSRCDEHGD
jgi:hypothetical protein